LEETVAGSGVFTPSKGTVFVNGTAPFVYDGQILSSAPELKIITPAVFYNSLNPPPANKITGLLDYIWDAAPEKYTHPNFSDQTRHFKLGRLVMPQNGRQCRITLLAGQGYDLSNVKNGMPFAPKNYCCTIHIYSGNAASLSSGPSIALVAGSNISAATSHGCFHYGFVSNISKWARPNNVYLCPNISDPLNEVSVWIENSAWWGTPVIEVLTNGTWYPETAMSQFLPNYWLGSITV
jgi:hypothetical protein